MDFEDWTREMHHEFQELRTRSREKRRMIAIWAMSAVLLLGAVLFAAFAK